MQINMEVKLDPSQIANMKEFVSILTEMMHLSKPGSLVIWYVLEISLCLFGVCKQFLDILLLPVGMTVLRFMVSLIGKIS